MRRALAEELESIASLDDSLVFLTADLGFGVFDSFKERFPSRYINVGIAEAGMVGLAAGIHPSCLLDSFLYELSSI